MRRSVACLLAAMACSPCLAQTADDSMHPIAAQAMAAVGEADTAFVMIVRFKTLEGETGNFLAAMADPRAETLKESGNLAYELGNDPNDERSFVLYEKWKSVAALDSHLKQPYLVKLGEALGVVLSEPPTIGFYLPVE